MYVTTDQLKAMVQSLEIENQRLLNIAKTTRDLAVSTKTLSRVIQINAEVVLLVNACKLYKDDPNGIKLPDYFKTS